MNASTIFSLTSNQELATGPTAGQTGDSRSTSGLAERFAALMREGTQDAQATKGASPAASPAKRTSDDHLKEDGQPPAIASSTADGAFVLSAGQTTPITFQTTTDGPTTTSGSTTTPTSLSNGDPSASHLNSSLLAGADMSGPPPSSFIGTVADSNGNGQTAQLRINSAMDPGAASPGFGLNQQMRADGVWSGPPTESGDADRNSAATTTALSSQFTPSTQLSPAASAPQIGATVATNTSRSTASTGASPATSTSTPSSGSSQIATATARGAIPRPLNLTSVLSATPSAPASQTAFSTNSPAAAPPPKSSSASATIPTATPSAPASQTASSTNSPVAAPPPKSSSVSATISTVTRFSPTLQNAPAGISGGVQPSPEPTNGSTTFPAAPPTSAPYQAISGTPRKVAEAQYTVEAPPSVSSAINSSSIAEPTEFASPKSLDLRAYPQASDAASANHDAPSSLRPVRDVSAGVDTSVAGQPTRATSSAAAASGPDFPITSQLGSVGDANNSGASFDWGSTTAAHTVNGLLDATDSNTKGISDRGLGANMLRPTNAIGALSPSGGLSTGSIASSTQPLSDASSQAAAFPFPTAGDLASSVAFTTSVQGTQSPTGTYRELSRAIPSTPADSLLVATNAPQSPVVSEPSQQVAAGDLGTDATTASAGSPSQPHVTTLRTSSQGSPLNIGQVRTNASNNAPEDPASDRSVTELGSLASQPSADPNGIGPLAESAATLSFASLSQPQRGPAREPSVSGTPSAQPSIGSPQGTPQSPRLSTTDPSTVAIRSDSGSSTVDIASAGSRVSRPTSITEQHTLAPQPTVTSAAATTRDARQSPTDVTGQQPAPGASAQQPPVADAFAAPSNALVSTPRGLRPARPSGRQPSNGAIDDASASSELRDNTSTSSPDSTSTSSLSTGATPPEPTAAPPGTVAHSGHVGVNGMTGVKMPTTVDATTSAGVARIRDAMASVANQAVIRGASSGTVELPDLGRVSVNARNESGAIDISITASHTNAQQLLQNHAHAMVSDLRNAELPVSKLTVEQSISSGSSFGSPTAQGDSHSSSRETPQHNGAASDLDDDDLPSAPQAFGRVRIVL